jgi:hypothetical protein
VDFPALGSREDQALEEIARRIYAACISYHHGISYQTALGRAGTKRPGDLWIQLAWIQMTVQTDEAVTIEVRKTSSPPKSS